MSFNRIHSDNVQSEKTREVQILADRLSMQFYDLDTIAFSLLSNNKTAAYTIDKGGYFGVIATKEVFNHQVGNSFIEDIALYTQYNKRDLFTSSQSICAADIALSHKYGYPSSAKRIIDQKIDQLKPVLLDTEEFFVEPFESYKKPNYNNSLIYIRPSPVQSSSVSSTVLFLIKESTMQRYAEQALTGYEGYVYLLGEENELIYSFKADEVSLDAQTLLTQIDVKSAELENQLLQIGKTDYTVFHESLKNLPYSLLLVIPTAQYLKPMEEWLGSFYKALLWLAAAGVIITIIITFANYMPIYKYARVLKNFFTHSQNPPLGKELPYISTAFQSLSHQNMNLRKKSQEYSVIRTREFLMSLLNGTCSKASLESDWSVSNIRADKACFAVLCLGLDNYRGFQKENSMDMQLMLKEAIIGQGKKTFVDVGDAYGVEMGETGVHAVLLNTESVEKLKVDLPALAEKLIYYFQENFDISITAGISKPYYSLHETPAAFSQAQTALDFRLVYGVGKIILYNDSMASSTAPYWYPVLLEQKLKDAISSLELEEASSIISQMIQEFHKQNLSIKRVQFICGSIVGSLISFMYHQNIEADADFREIERLFINFHFETLTEVEQHLDQLMRVICTYISRQQAQTENLLIKDILQYINDNYKDSGLCLQNLADNFNYSVSYISRTFKEQTGQTLISHLDNVRMQNAKQLLRETDYTIAHILSLVGYNDKNNFIRKFRRAEGTTPMQYRNDYQSRLVFLLNE